MADNNKEKMKKKMMLEIVTPYSHFFEGQVTGVVIPSLDGGLGVLPGHAPLVVALTPGHLEIIINDERRFAVLTEGYAEIGQHLVLIVCNAAEWPEDINIRRAYDAYNRAYARYHEMKLNSEESLYARHSMKRARERMHLIFLHGSDSQKEQLNSLTGGTLPQSFDVSADNRV
ncbi:MAG: ATP synthase F1 subunit epsilon [Clostridiaceae bacterium]|nr:ATP synthase F1 subunit epsilon [Clostridiaceae bacterium]